MKIIASVILMFGCSSPKPFEIKDVCAQPEGTKAILQSYLSLPKTIDTIQITKGGRITSVGYQIFLMTEADATGDAAKVTIWTRHGQIHSVITDSRILQSAKLIFYRSEISVTNSQRKLFPSTKIWTTLTLSPYQLNSKTSARLERDTVLACFCFADFCKKSSELRVNSS